MSRNTKMRHIELITQNRRIIKTKNIQKMRVNTESRRKRLIKLIKIIVGEMSTRKM